MVLASMRPDGNVRPRFTPRTNRTEGLRMNLRLRLAAATLAAAVIAGPAIIVSGPANAALPASIADAAPMPSLAPMVKRVSAAVVNIATRGTIKEEPGQRN